ncbi:acetylglutamate kinase [Legionella israelensis]|uniref:Acetylglutamate kinase n=1 Tax=Legionella israelensis TaxID=454 RepID=A0A0W0WS23_9GAMM|nr:acetylglutamate kinase [Legionella israelensis]KTD35129.1 Acetylglutamate kinase [Legionella israelensis]QBS08714.1 acetylglutamate kinase [Legionella israelensis]SCY01404.1 N-acetylglutamate kinase [Legionella israelensis DSM 19235]STX58386.1 Acetylglutamate kinase [Legionella israelensis]
MIEKRDTAPIIEVLHYANDFAGKTFLLKLGGSILQDEMLIDSVCQDIKRLHQAGIRLVIVHGGSKAINQCLAEHKIKADFIDGLRITSREAMQLIEKVLCTQVNKILVDKLKQIGLQAMGISAATIQLLPCRYYSRQHGFVGVIQSVNLSKFKPSSDSISVIAPIGVDAADNSLNVNADYAASKLAVALNVDKLIFMTDQNGIYAKDGSVYSELDSNELIKLINDQTVVGGMLIKTKAILSALNEHLNHVHILNGNIPQVLLKEIFTTQGVGTLCKASSK